ncbi:EAL domain-containing protein [Phytobacter palmae]|nr:EAL domain-containing protein [Phytobacter palmae]
MAGQWFAFPVRLASCFGSATVACSVVYIRIADFHDEGLVFVKGACQSVFKNAIDDFGAGLARFARLKRPQADIIKMDGYFMWNIAHAPQEQRALRLTVRRIGDYQRGCLLAKPQSLIATRKE